MDIFFKSYQDSLIKKVTQIKEYMKIGKNIPYVEIEVITLCGINSADTAEFQNP